MTICHIDGYACDCQPDEGVPCRNLKNDLPKALIHAWECGNKLGQERMRERAAKACEGPLSDYAEDGSSFAEAIRALKVD